MRPRTPRSPRTYTLFPYTTRFRSMAGEESHRVHAAHRIADQAGQALDAQRPYHGMRGVGAVLDRHLGEGQPIEFARCGVGRCGPGGTLELPSALKQTTCRSEEHTSELQSLMRHSSAVF